MATLASNGSRTDVQAKCDAANPGDVVTIPANNSYTWSGPVIVSSTGPKNITLRSTDTSATAALNTIINGTAGAGGGLITWQTENTSDFTARLSGLTFNWPATTAAAPMIMFSGNAQVHLVGGVPKSGLRFDHCIIKGAENQKVIRIDGYIFGVADHIILDHLSAPNGRGETWIINHSTQPDGTGNYGDYSWFAAFTQGGLDNFFVEDCVLLHHDKCLDSQNSGFEGGTKIVVRHNTSTGSAGGGHGTRESGGRTRGPRSEDIYKNHYVRDKSQGGVIFARWRDGEPTAWGNRYTFTNGLTAGTGFVTRPMTYAAYGGATSTDDFYFGQGPDGTHPLDNNQKGSFSLGGPSQPQRPAASYVPDATYTTTSGTPGVDFGTHARTTITAGVDSVSTAGDVYAHGIGAIRGEPLAANGSNTGSVAYLTITLTGMTGMQVNKWAGFIIRHTDMPVLSAKPPSWTLITSNTANDFKVSQHNQTGGSDSLLNQGPPFDSNTHWEICRIKEYFGVPGGGSADSSNPNNMMADLPPTDVGGPPPRLVGGSPNPRWVNYGSPGIWLWNNKYRLSTSAPGWTPTLDLPLADTPGSQFLAIRNVHNNEVKPGYNYSESQTPGPGNPDTRVGADDEAINLALAGTNIASLPAYASVYDVGTGGYTYPHPLVTPPTIVPNQISVTGPTTVNEGNSAVYTIQDTSPAPIGGVSVTYTYTGTGTNPAVAGTDYTAPYAGASGSVIIGTAGTSQTVTVTTLVNPGTGDHAAKFLITAVSGGGSTINSAANSVTTTIKDTASPAPSATIAVSPTTVNEGSASIFTITLSTGAATNLTINYSVSGTAVSGTNFTALPGTASITTGTSAVNIQCSTINVGEMGSDKTVILTVTSGTGYTVSSPASATLTIHNTGPIVPPSLAPPTIVVSA